MFGWLVILIRKWTQIRQLIENAYSKFANDDLLKCPKLTPFLLYVSTIATSKWQEGYFGQ